MMVGSSESSVIGFGSANGYAAGQAMSVESADLAANPTPTVYTPTINAPTPGGRSF